jgi:MerR family copper efflux transcriptional regulator
VKIGEVAAEAGVSVQAVRFYERSGILPEPPRSPSGYRSYGPDDLQRVRFVRRAKELGFTLSEVRELLELRVDPRRTADDVRTRTEVKIQATRSKIRDLQRIEHALQHLVDHCQAHGSPDACALMHAIGAEDHEPEGGRHGQDCTSHT